MGKKDDSVIYLTLDEFTKVADEIIKLVRLAADINRLLNGKLHNTASELYDLVDGADLSRNDVMENKMDDLREVFMWSKDTATMFGSLTKISATLKDMTNASKET